MAHSKAWLGQVGDTDIRLLKVFKAVVDCGGMAAAELELNIGRSTISRHVKDLEQRLGLVLCRRGRGGFALTDDGQRVHADTLQLLDALESFRTHVGQMHGELTGTLRLGLFDKTVTNPAARIDRAIRAFRERAPQVRLDLTVGAINVLEPAVIDGQLQLAIVPDHRRSQSLNYAPLFPEQMRLYGGREHPLFGRQRVGLDDLRAVEFAGLAFHSPNMEATRRLGLKRSAVVNDQEAVALLVRSGRYVGFLPEHYAALFEAQGEMRRLGPAEVGYLVDFVAVTRGPSSTSRLTQTFLQCLVAAHAPA
ncbi:MAG: LysR family transcriptional regulator [Hydrogenophaga sp.]|uniref:LysR family transcriptional regulator n=1 Tax=Hydrogenophaga sp. TaxID=1904254 RepID=UPI0025C1934F|nr:LysR family transcriptional regulator [Hydrogenophaga sp.]MBT9552706.1 LysR family transcriptional regulator [Hydrogenophaga sp.]